MYALGKSLNANWCGQSSDFELSEARGSEVIPTFSRTSTASAVPLRMSTGPFGLSLGFLSLADPNRVAMPQLYWREPACSSTEGHSHLMSPSMHCAHERGCVLLYWDVLSYACTRMYVHTWNTYDRMSACIYVSMCGRICTCTRGCFCTCTCGCIDVIYFWNRSHAKVWTPTRWLLIMFQYFSILFISCQFFELFNTL